MRRALSKVLALSVAALLVLTVLATAAPEKIIFLSTQLAPAREKEFVVSELLPKFTEETGIEVEFVTKSYAEFVQTLLAEHAAGKVTASVVGSLYGDFVTLTEAGVLDDLAKYPKLPDRTFIKTFEELAKIRGIKAFVPWMQATYLIVANKKALKYFPEGRDPYAMTYDDLLQWAKNMYEATGEPKFGLPAGEKGLIHRFIHGYLYPSFTGKQVGAFDSLRAVKMWKYMKELWKYTNPASTTYNEMYEPLLAEEVWVAWDHTARLIPALRERPEDFVVLPAPAGPYGRGFIIVLAGLGMPKLAPDKDAAWRLIEYLTRPEVQARVTEVVGFFPTVEEAAGALPAGPLRALGEGVTKQASAPDALVAFIPALGPYGGEFSRIYRQAFERIVLKGEPIEDVLLDLVDDLEGLFQKAKAPYPPPG